MIFKIMKYSVMFPLLILGIPLWLPLMLVMSDSFQEFKDNFIDMVNQP